MKKRRRIGGTVKDRQTLTEEIGASQFCLMDLPVAVLHEILFRLPINSILKVKFVCRALYKLVSNPDFALNYTKISSVAAFLIPNKLCGDPLRYQNLDLLEVCDNDKCTITTFKPKIPGWSKRISGFLFAGICNGLICLSLRESQTEIVYICNPIMGECMPLPERKIELGEDVDAEYGFGFCRSTNNYKVLRIVCKPGSELSKREGKIFTIGIDHRWRDLGNPTIPYKYFFNNFIAVSGVLHWIVMDNDSTWICTFDLGEEKIGQLLHPHGLVLNRHTKLKSLNNQLCLVDIYDPSVTVIWKMKEYGVAESWTKDVILDYSFSSNLRCRRLFPETIFQNGDIFFSSELGDYLILYNPMEGRLTRSQVRSYERITYTPSFLSLKEAVMGGHKSTMNV
ncbi:hypothetical protein BUALT_Bualt10G0074400 [Buddleja alternifolia]|uniref:F-box domain-containing protein n=1 Tax=Buddleja alternifolia TaxID=168488 RepID=A0AAV6WYI2_9LAMI|nr:hypothetical protein BUALT_Bualt10G0074400 [Buddleja alternifolia]